VRLTAADQALFDYIAHAGPLSAYGASHEHMREQPQIWTALPRRQRARLPKTEAEARERLEALVQRGVIRRVRWFNGGVHYGVPGTYHPDDEVS
jgi:hypothetical protein